MGEAGEAGEGESDGDRDSDGEGGRPSREGAVCVGDAPSGWEAGDVGEGCSHPEETDSSQVSGRKMGMRL